MAVQAAFHQDGLSLSDPGTFTRIAAAAGLDTLDAGATRTTPAPLSRGRGRLPAGAALGAQAYPTLLAQDGDRTAVLAIGHAGPDTIDTLLEQFGAAHTRPAASGR